MIHLLDRIYLEYAEAKPMLNNPLLDPESYIRLVDRGLSGIADAATADKNLFNEKSLESAIEKFGSSQNLFNFLLDNSNTSNTKKIVIYSDEQSMVKALIGLWKALFPKLEADGAFSLYISYGDYEALKLKEERTYIAFDEDSREIEKKDFLSKYWGRSSLEFKNLFDSVPAFDLSDEQKDKKGLEFKVISALISKHLDASLQKKINHFYKKLLIKEVQGFKNFCIEYMPALLESSDNSATLLSEKSLIEFLKTHPDYSFVLDEKITRSIAGYDHLRANYNLIKISKSLIEAQKMIVAREGLDPHSVEIDNPCSAFILKHKEEPNLAIFLEEEVDHRSPFRIFREIARKGRYNNLLVHAFYKALKTNGVESLLQFS